MEQIIPGNDNIEEYFDKESGGLLSSLEKKEKSETNEMTSYINLLSRPTSNH